MRLPPTPPCSAGGEGDPQLIVKSSSFPEEQISDNWDRGMYIRSMVWDGERFVLLFENGDVPQSLYMDKVFPEAEIEDLWQDCYVCSNLVFADGKWVLVSNELSRNNHQGWVSDTIFPTDDLDELLCAGGLQPKLVSFSACLSFFFCFCFEIQMMCNNMFPFQTDINENHVNENPCFSSIC
jgi:hypothetical protein